MQAPTAIAPPFLFWGHLMPMSFNKLFQPTTSRSAHHARTRISSPGIRHRRHDCSSRLAWHPHCQDFGCCWHEQRPQTRPGIPWFCRQWKFAMALTLFPFFDSVCRDASCGNPCLGHSVRSQQRVFYPRPELLRVHRSDLCVHDDLTTSLWFIGGGMWDVRLQ